MRRSAEPIRRGAALLIVLATLVLVTTASVSLLQRAVTARVGWNFSHNTVEADDMADAADAPIRHWLTTTSMGVVLAPDIDVPRIEVLHDVWQIDGVTYEIRINAWDQCGMVPATVARSGSPLRLCLPESVRRILDQTDLPRGQSLGLDFYIAESGAEAPMPVFPAGSGSLPIWFGAGDELRDEPSVSSEAAPPVTVGAYLATHNDRSINVNTAPRDLVEAALRAAGRGGSEAILNARALGKSASVSGLPATGQPDRSAPRIVGASNAWAMRVDVRVGALQRSWWSVYVKQRSNQWEHVQRLAIPE